MKSMLPLIAAALMLLGLAGCSVSVSTSTPTVVLTFDHAGSVATRIDGATGLTTSSASSVDNVTTVNLSGKSFGGSPLFSVTGKVTRTASGAVEGTLDVDSKESVKLSLEGLSTPSLTRDGKALAIPATLDAGTYSVKFSGGLP